MPTYIVSIREVVNLQVEADDEEAAKVEAIDTVVEVGSEKYFMNVEDREVYMTLKKAERSKAMSPAFAAPYGETKPS